MTVFDLVLNLYREWLIIAKLVKAQVLASLLLFCIYSVFDIDYI